MIYLELGPLVVMLLVAWLSGGLIGAGVVLWRLAPRQATPAEIQEHAWHTAEKRDRDAPIKTFEEKWRAGWPGKW